MLADWTTDSVCNYHGESLKFRLALSHPGCVLFESSEFALLRGRVTGLVGTNGSGKTSLAKVIASKELPSFPADLSIQYVSSHENYFLGKYSEVHLTPEEYLRSVVDSRLTSLQEDIDHLEESLGNDPDSIEEISLLLNDKYTIIEELETTSKTTIAQTLSDLGFAPYLQTPISKLSCGWRYKCQLITAFMVSPDVLIIDEPSFLDASSTEWLIQKIMHTARERNAMVLLISHKVHLLDALCDRIWYINSANKTLTSYNCGYETFRTSHESAVNVAEKTCAEYEQNLQAATKSLKHIQSQLRKREQSFKKTTTEHADQRFIKGKNKEAKQKADRSAAAKLKQLKQQSTEIEELHRQALCEQVKPLSIPGMIASGPVVHLSDVSFSYDTNCLFHNLNISVDAQERILLCGPNGCGKSTLLRLMLGEIEPTSGVITRSGHVLYFPQTALSDLSSNYGTICAAEYLGSGESITETAARKQLGDFGLTGDVALRPILSLSAGQRVRLWLAKHVMLHPHPSLLIMDEVSENLDVETRQSLTDVISSFQGAVIVVTHDIDFAETYNVTQIWRISQGSVAQEFVN